MLVCVYKFLYTTLNLFLQVCSVRMITQSFYQYEHEENKMHVIVNFFMIAYRLHSCNYLILR
jgi:hypothetical protein